MQIGKINYCQNCGLPITKVRADNKYCVPCKQIVYEFNRSYAFIDNCYGKLAAQKQKQLVLLILKKDLGI